MAQVRDYLDYLEAHYGFAPVNSQEEVLAAQTIAEALEDHKLATGIEEFSAPSWGRRLYAIPMILLFLAVILCFFNGVPRVIGVLLLLVCTVLLVGWRLQMFDPFANLGPKAQSQNVIAKRAATGVPEGERPGRPIVIMAHYDTGREEILAHPIIAPWRDRLVSCTIYTVPALVLFTLISLLPFLPVGAKFFLLVLALIAAIPTLLWGISEISALIAPLTAGSVDNKSSVAALLSLADKVCYGVAWHPDRRRRLLVQDTRQEPAEAPAEAQIVSQETIVHPTEEPLEGLTVPMAPLDPLEEDVAQDLSETGTDAPQSEPGDPFESVVEPQDFDEPVEKETEPATANAEPAEPAVAVEAEPVAEPAPKPESTDETAFDVPEAPEPVRHGAALVRELGILPDSCELVYTDPSSDEATIVMPPLTPEQADELYIRDEEPAQHNKPEFAEVPSVESEQWGQSDFDIESVRPARRSVLVDLPDPSRRSLDPLGSDRSFRVNAPAIDNTYLAEFDVISPEEGAKGTTPETMQRESRFSGALSRLFGRRGGNAEPAPRTSSSPSNDWGDVDDEDDNGRGNGGWKGGAARSEKLRFVPPVEGEEAKAQDAVAEEPVEQDEPTAAEAPVEAVEPEVPAVESEPEDTKLTDPDATIFAPYVEEHRDASATVNDIFAEEEAAAEQAGHEEKSVVDDSGLDKMGDVPTEEAPEEQVDYELREAITAMGDADLQSHDIWFVAVGGSEIDHAGAKHFIESHRRELRGAFVINLSCVGAGELTVITDEGVVPHRRSDRRIVRFASAAADDLHIPIHRASINWGDTDAMAVMRRSMRAATIMGCSAPGVPAISHTADDLPGVPDKRQIADVVELVAETIRRA